MPRTSRELPKHIWANSGQRFLACSATSDPGAADAYIDTPTLLLRLGHAPRGGTWNTGMAILRANDLVRETPQGWVPVA